VTRAAGAAESAPEQDLQTAAPAAPGRPLVEVTGLAKSFGKLGVFDEVSLAVGPGELVVLTGSSGSGKTTLLRLLHGQLRPTRGSIWVAGRSLHRLWRRGLGRVRRDVGFIFQDFRLLPRLTALENIILALQISDPQLPYSVIRRRALEVLEALSLGHRGRAYPAQLSAGEQQRVAVARALAGHPQILLADEPVTAIDAQNAHIVVRLLEEAAANGAAVIVASHHNTYRSHRELRLPEGKILPGHRGRKAGVSAQPVRPRLWRRLLALCANSFRLVVLSGLRSWRRDLRLIAPALGSMALLFLLCGLLSLVGVAVADVGARAADQASVVRVYLAPDAAPADVAALKARLAADPRVESIREVSAEQALREANGRPGLGALASLSTSNPFPASLDVRARRLTDVGTIAALAKGDPAADPSYPTSYDPDAYSRLQRMGLIIGGIGAGLLLLFLFVAYSVVANSMRAIATARREEVLVTRLLGARGWMLRGPFVVQGLATGAFAGALAAAVVAGGWFLADRFAAATYSQVLPGAGPVAIRFVVAGLLTAGLVLGALTALLGFRRLRA